MNTEPTRHTRGSSWKQIDLTDLLRSDYKKPRPTIGEVENSETDGTILGLFYPGKINTVFGDSGGGKSWISLWAMVEQMLSGNDVVLIDYEDDATTHIGRMRQMGVSDETIAKHFIYIQPNEKWDGAAKATLRDTLAGRTPTVAVIDSFGEALGVDGFSANADEEVATWIRGTARFLADARVCVILLDHTVKSITSARSTDFASGTQRKRASISGAAYFLKVIDAPSRWADGHLQFISRKCRHGWWPKDTVAADVFITNLPDCGVKIVVRKPSDTSIKPKVFRPTVYMQRISDYLQAEGDARSKTQIVEGVGGKFNAVSAAIGRLVSEGYCTSEPGPRKASLITLVKPYDEATDEKNPEPF
jgi:archaellum biogenesis ATPase FlaH